MEELNFKTNSQALNPRHVLLDYYQASNTVIKSVCHTRTQLQHLVWKMTSAQLGLCWMLHFGQRAMLPSLCSRWGWNSPTVQPTQPYTSITHEQALTPPWKGQCVLLTWALVLVFTGVKRPSQVCVCFSQQEIRGPNIFSPRVCQLRAWEKEKAASSRSNKITS